MIQETIDSIRLLDYPNERIRARLLDNQLVPIVEGGDIFFASPLEDGSLKVSRSKAFTYEELRRPTLTPRMRVAHKAYLERLTELCPRLVDVASVIGVRTTRLHPLFRRYEVPLSRYRVQEGFSIPEDLDTIEFKELFEVEAYTLRELSEHFALKVGTVLRLIDELELIGPIDAIKRAKRLERNPQYLEIGGKRLPPPTPVQLEVALHDGHDTVAKLATLFNVSPKTMSAWLDEHGIETPAAKARRNVVKPSNFNEIIYQEVIVKRRKIPEVAKELKLNRGVVWREANKFPEWNDVQTRLKTIPNELLGRLYYAVKDKRMKKKEACTVAGVSHKTLDREFARYVAEREGGVQK